MIFVVRQNDELEHLIWQGSFNFIVHKALHVCHLKNISIYQ